MKVRLYGTGKRVIELSKRFGIRIVKYTKLNIKNSPALIIDDSFYCELKDFTDNEIINIIKVMQEA